MIDLSVIVISYNTKDTTLACLASIYKYSKGFSFEVIVVDNHSKDGSFTALKNYSSKHANLQVVKSDENIGFGRANNIGALKAKGDYLLFLNSDTLLFDNALKRSLDFVKKKDDLGVYSCRLLNPDKTTQPSGGYFPTLLNLFAWQFFIDDLPLIGPLIPSFHPHPVTYTKEKDIDWVTGAFMLIPRKVFITADGFDKNIFMYTEEMELVYRINNLGFKTYYRNDPAIIHLGGVSGGSVLALTSEIKNMLYFWKKHKPHWQLPLVRFAFVAGSLLRWLIFGIIKGDEKKRQAYTEACKLAI